jgi:hypothetical protein
MTTEIPVEIPLETSLIAAVDNAPGASLDADGKVYLDYLQNSKGYTPTATEKKVVSQFFRALKAINLWNDMRALYLYIGGTAATHAVNARNPGTNTITWHGAMTHNAKGSQTDGATGYGDPGLTANTAGSNDYGLYGGRVKFDCSFGGYNQNGHRQMMGVQRNNNATPANGFLLMDRGWDNPNHVTSEFGGDCFDGSIGDGVAYSYGVEHPTTAQRQGLWTINGFESGTTVKIYKNGTAVATGTPSKQDITQGNSPAALPFYLFCYNRFFMGSSWTNAGDGLDDGQSCFHYYFGNVTTPEQQSGFYSAVQALQVALGRGL